VGETSKTGNGGVHPFQSSVQTITIASGIKRSALSISHAVYSQGSYGLTDKSKLEDAYSIGVHLSDYSYEAIRHGKHIGKVSALKGCMVGCSLREDPQSIMLDPFENVLFHIQQGVFDAFSRQHDLPMMEMLNLQSQHSFSDPTMFHLAKAYLPALTRPAEANRLFIDYISLAVVAHLAGTYGGIRAKAAIMRGGLSSWQLRLAKELIETRLDSALTLSDLAQHCGMSVGHFSRGFSKSVGMPPHRWMLNRRLERAKDMLLNTKCSITEVSLACGFSDQAHMTRLFSAAFSVSPGTWRRRSR
jgi:AraC-like DNA-binding protein